MGVLWPGSDGMVGVCFGVIGGEVVSSSERRVGVLRLVCPEDAVPLLFLACAELLEALEPFVGRERTGADSTTSTLASRSWRSI